jgi:general secretion pathway protein C
MRLGKINISESTKIAKILLYAAIAFAAFSIADLTIIYFRDRMLPNQAPPKKMTPMAPSHFVDRSQFSVIPNRNLFSSLGIMPDAITANKNTQKKDADPIPSNLPLNLIGTLVHSNPEKSIAAVEVKSKNMTGSYVTGADIEGLAKVERVERNRVFIRNNNTGAVEYIEMKTANKVSFDAMKTPAAPTKPGGNEVISTGTNQFQIKRADLLKYTNDLSSVLMQARAVPNRDPNTGEINGFRILDMQPGSIYEQLGLQRMDVLKSVNGEPIDSVQKAMELYNTLKNGNQVKLGIDRGGKTDTMTYDVK